MGEGDEGGAKVEKPCVAVVVSATESQVGTPSGLGTPLPSPSSSSSFGFMGVVFSLNVDPPPDSHAQGNSTSGQGRGLLEYMCWVCMDTTLYR